MTYNRTKGIGPRGLGVSPLKELRKALHVKRNSTKVSPRKPPLKVGRADGTGLKKYNDKGILE